MPNRLVSVGDDFTLPAAVVVADANLPAASNAAAVAAKQDAATLDAAVTAKITTPGSAVAGALSATYADSQDLAHPTRLDFIRRGKGGTIGTGGRPVIAFRFDHYVDATLATIWPLFVARGIPAGMGLISRPNNPVDPTAASWATIKTMVSQGNEVWSHSATHSDPGNTWAGMVDEIQNSRIELEAQGLTVMGWQMAGTATTNPNYGSNFTTAAQFATPAGKLLMANYGLIEAYAGGARRVLPTYGCYGLDHVTVESLTLTILKGDVDRAISLGLGVEFMIHSNRIGAPGYLSLADFTALLDYVVTKRDAGQIEVLTPSGLAFADPTHARRMNLIYGGDFETQTTAAPSPWSLPAGGTIETTGGATGSRFLRIASTGASVGQGNSLVKTLNMNGFAFEIRGMIRYPSDLTVGRVTAVDNTVPATPVIITQRDITPTAANTWQPFRVPFVMPKDTATFKLELRRLSTSGTTIDYDDVHVYAV